MTKKKRPAIQPPASKIPTREEILEVGGQAHEHLMACISDLGDAKTLPEQVRLGLLVKILKMYHNLLRIADSGDSDTPPILARGVYEYVLSAAYMVVHDEAEPGIYESFRKSALIRTHLALTKVRKSKMGDRESTTVAIAALENLLSSESYDPAAEKLSIPKSWHPDKSYQAMAKELGGEFEEFYNLFYEMTSTYVHPNWLDIKKQLRFSPSGGASANLLNSTLSVHPMATATCMVLRLAEVYRINLIKLGYDKQIQVEAIEQINKTHYSLHN